MSTGRWFAWWRQIASAVVATLFVCGCAAPKSKAPPAPTIHPSTASLSAPSTSAPALSPPVIATAESFKNFQAAIDPPTGWMPDPLRVDAKHVHGKWISPSGNTAYGVILMHLPLPVGSDLVLHGFLNHMRDIDVSSDLVSREPAPDVPGLRFVADSAHYRLRVNLIVKGWTAWAFYAGTRRDAAINETELRTAELARDRSHVAAQVGE